MRDRLRHFFDAPFETSSMAPLFAELISQPVGLRPPVEVTESPEEFVVTAELPGMEQKDVHLDFEDGVLTIRGEKEEVREEKGDKRRYLMWERSYGSFQRSLSLDGVDGEQIRANYKDGVLTVRLPKTPATKSKTREIRID
ncbi:MAG TPA: Hsp20/alpha crystallin family protein [Gemmatimonadaceae bacterium]|nr:Hsp20/alpha crystallin family protein [Gemmatimonadaceae bacterium]